MYNNSLDPDILKIISGEAFSGEVTPTEIKAPEPPQPVQYRQQETHYMNAMTNGNMSAKNEVAEQTNALDSQGNVIHVGDKVVIGNDRAIGRIVKLGKHALVNLQDEGTFEFPCTVLTLYSQQRQQFNMQQPQSQPQFGKQIEQQSALPKTGKFESYTIESMMNSHIVDADIESMNESISDIATRLTQANDGQSFNMGIN